MKIAIDARMMGPMNTRGIGRYIEELIRAMLVLEPEHEYHLIVREKAHAFVAHPSVRTQVVDIGWYGLREQVLMPRVLGRIGADVVHVPHWNVPFLLSGRLVVTVHDLLLLHFSESAKMSMRSWPVRMIKRIGYRLVLDHAIGAARRILVPTKFVEKDIVGFYPRAVSRIKVTGEGMPALNIKKDLPHHHPSFLLYVGSAYPHKGLADLMVAWKKIALAYPALHLWIAGERDVFMRALEAGISREDLGRVKFLGRVTDERLVELYENAVALVYPSHFEGFGLPPLEALARGCPVISSDAGALPEVLADEGVFSFHVGDSNAILGCVQEIMDDPAKARAKSVVAAEKLSRVHDWRTAAQSTLDAYREAIS